MDATVRLCEALNELEDTDLTVLTLTKRVRRIERHKRDGLNVVYIPHQWGELDALLGRPLTRWRMNQEIGRIVPDIIHAQGEAPYILYALHVPVPAVVTIHGIYQNEIAEQLATANLRTHLRQWATLRDERYYTTRIKNLIVITSQVEGFVRERSPQVHAFRIDNPIDPRFFQVAEYGAQCRILFIGLVCQRKGVHILLDAFRQISGQFPDCSLRIAGPLDFDPKYVANLRRGNADLLQSHRAELLGKLTMEDLLDELGACTCLVLPSFSESAPLVVSQAQAAGKPVIASQVGGVPGLIQDGETGILVEPRDAEKLAVALRKLLTDEVLRQRISMNAARIARERYEPVSVAKKTLSAYREIVRNYVPTNRESPVE
jgi:glycosyltransferase involved in cell wall biosynthesis